MGTSSAPSVDREELRPISDDFVLPRSIAHLPEVTATACFAIGLWCLLGWAINQRGVGVTMNPLSTIGVMLAAASVWFSSRAPARRTALWLGRFLAYLVILIALAKLSHLLFHF